MRTDFQQNWDLKKPIARGRGGMVAAQHRAAAEVGADILRAGGNAVDAAIATSMALGVLEPWMSGLGGGGQMVVAPGDGSPARAIAFGMVAPRKLDPADYPLSGGRGSDLFPWPAVLEDRNVNGYHAIAVPGLAAGLGLAHERFGSKPWAALVEPAIALADEGHPVSWNTTLLIASAAAALSQFDTTRSVYLPAGLPPTPLPGGELPRLDLGKLADTLRHLAAHGPQSFYEGALADALVADLGAGGSRITIDDLSAYQAREVDPLVVDHAGMRVMAPPGLTAGPTLAHALELIGGRIPAGSPGVAAYLAWAEALGTAYAHRLATMGDADDSRDPASTSHICVVDRHGTMVSLTQTLLSAFGSKVVSPSTGILMNNGIMWFDPRPGGPNAIRPGRHPLSNMCPVVVTDPGGAPRFAVGACGGRRILPAVLQLASMLLDCGLDLETAFHAPRIDASGEDFVTADEALAPEILAALEARHRVIRREHAVLPSLFATPCCVLHDREAGEMLGANDLMTPVSGAAAVEGV